MTENFVDVRVLDNFYQTSSFFPMPIVMVSTVSESGQTNLGPYSLCFPHLIAGKHAMILLARFSSNTAQNIIRTGTCALNFLSADKRYLENCVELGYPGETTAEKMENSIFTLLPSTRTAEQRQPEKYYPEIIEEAVQVFECTWDSSYAMEYDEKTEEAHFVLLIDKIVMQERYRDMLFKGKELPPIAVGYGFRDNRNFWFARKSQKYSIPIPESKGIDIDAVKWAASRYDPSIQWTDEAYAKLVKVPRIFLSKVVAQCIEAAKAEGLDEITPEFLDRVRDKRTQDREEGGGREDFWGTTLSWLQSKMKKRS